MDVNIYKYLTRISVAAFFVAVVALFGFSWWLAATEASAQGQVREVLGCTNKLYERFQNRNCLRYQIYFEFDNIGYTEYLEEKYGKQNIGTDKTVYFSRQRPSVTASLYTAKDRAKDYIFVVIVLSILAGYTSIRYQKLKRATHA